MHPNIQMDEKIIFFSVRKSRIFRVIIRKTESKDYVLFGHSNTGCLMFKISLNKQKICLIMKLFNMKEGVMWWLFWQIRENWQISSKPFFRFLKYTFTCNLITMVIEKHTFRYLNNLVILLVTETFYLSHKNRQ